MVWSEWFYEVAVDHLHSESLCSQLQIYMKFKAVCTDMRSGGPLKNELQS
jgi:hypothetical protein